MSSTIHRGDCLHILPTFRANSFEALLSDPPAAIGFMGQAWDHDRGGRTNWVEWLSQVMREALRVLKPGAHGLVWALPRRSHWTALALEDAGFEIRDCLHHYFLSGFPKSLAVDKAIDTLRGAKREVISSRKAHDIRNRRLIGSQNTMTYDYTAAESDDAKLWEGWGTHLKPAIEHWWLARKPLSERTIAENVLKWRTGALNIAACRIPAYRGKETWHNDQMAAPGTFAGRPAGNVSAQNGKRRPQTADPHPDSRYPSHFIVSDWRLLGDHTAFFHPPVYCPKARECRSEGNDHPTVKPVELMKYFITLLTRPGGSVLDCFAGSFTAGVAAQAVGCHYTGIEMDPRYVQIGLRRLTA